jgi:hypothetical protein
MANGRDAVEMNFRVLMIGFSQQELRFWPCLGEGLCAIFLKAIDLGAYHEDSDWCRPLTAEFIIKLWNGLPEMHELESTPLNRALPWFQGMREIATHQSVLTVVLQPIEGDKKYKLYFTNAGQYAINGLLCGNCYAHPKHANLPRPPALEQLRVFRVQNPKLKCCQRKDCHSTNPTDRIQSAWTMFGFGCAASVAELSWDETLRRLATDVELVVLLATSQRTVCVDCVTYVATKRREKAQGSHRR